MENLTLFIFTHNRHQYLERALTYYLSKTRFQILVCDSSAQIFSRVEMLANPRVRYLHFANMPYVEKMEKGLKEVSTEYVVLLPDDDFFLPNALERSIDFLVGNPEYSSAQGHWYSIFCDEKGYRFERTYHPLFYNRLCLSDIGQRLDYSIGCYLPLYCAVSKVDPIRKFFEMAPKYGIQSIVFSELGVAFFLLIHGNSATLPVPYVARENEIVETGAKIHPSLAILSQSAEGRAEIQRFIKMINDYWNEMVGLNSDLNHVDEINRILFERYLGHFVGNLHKHFGGWNGIDSWRYNSQFQKDPSKIAPLFLKKIRYIVALYRRFLLNKIIRVCNCFGFRRQILKYLSEYSLNDKKT